MREPFDHRPARWIRQSCEGCIQIIHNHMVVTYAPMSSVILEITSTLKHAPWSRSKIRSAQKCWPCLR